MILLKTSSLIQVSFAESMLFAIKRCYMVGVFCETGGVIKQFTTRYVTMAQQTQDLFVHGNCRYFFPLMRYGFHMFRVGHCFRAVWSLASSSNM